MAEISVTDAVNESLRGQQADFKAEQQDDSGVCDLSNTDVEMVRFGWLTNQYVQTAITMSL